MAQFGFYGCWEDSLQLLKMLIDLKRFTFVLDKWYSSPQPFQFTSLSDEVLSEVATARRLYVWSEVYSLYPAQFLWTTDREVGRIDPENGGPALDLFLPTTYEHDGKHGISLGWFAYQSKYYSPIDGEAYKPPEALKETFKELKSMLQKKMTRRFLPLSNLYDDKRLPACQTLWVGVYGAAKLEAGDADLWISGEYKTNKDLFRLKKGAEQYSAKMQQ